MSATSNVTTTSFKLIPSIWPLDGLGGHLRAGPAHDTILRAPAVAEGKTTEA